VIRRHGQAFVARHGSRLTPTQRKALAALAACRTAAMGARRWRCRDCGGERIVYNSCRDRHCPKCQGAQRAAWLERQRRQLLPVQYFHVVFTVPHDLVPLAAAHPRVFYRLLFRAARETLQQVAADPRHLQATIGGLMVLHTWGQNLTLHPHLHVIVPGGGLSADGQRWIDCPRGFFLPVKVLSRVFRGKLLDFLHRTRQTGGLPFRGTLALWNEAASWRRFLSSLYATEWVVYSKPPAAGPDVVLKYLARYTHRVAISNQRIECIADGQVTFRYKDYAQRSRWRRMTLSADEFLRRFLQHILPKGFVRIRSFGLLANRDGGRKLARCRELLAASPPAPCSTEENPASEEEDALRCPHCRRGRLRQVGESLRPTAAQLVAATYSPHWFDTS
jgi:hypothetical protein